MVDSQPSAAERVVELLKRRGLSLSVAESCTGGMIGTLVTGIPGSSHVFWGGFILYSNEAKIKLAGVTKKTLLEFGAVSSQTVEAMAQGTRERCGTDFSLAVSGIAGPDGGTEEKPVGTVWIGLSQQGQTLSRQFFFPGSRENVREKTTEEALQWLTHHIGKFPNNNEN